MTARAAARSRRRWRRCPSRRRSAPRATCPSSRSSPCSRTSRPIPSRSARRRARSLRFSPKGRRTGISRPPLPDDANRFTVTVEEKPKDASGPVPLRLTLVAGESPSRREVEPRRQRPAALGRETPSATFGELLDDNPGRRTPAPGHLPRHDAGRAGGEDHGRSLQGPQGGSRRRPRRLHADLPPQPPARLRAEEGRDQGEGRGRHPGDLRQRRVRDGSLGEGLRRPRASSSSPTAMAISPRRSA